MSKLQEKYSEIIKKLAKQKNLFFLALSPNDPKRSKMIKKLHKSAHFHCRIQK